ncbi:MAG: hypothetical protein KGL20_02640 [Rhodospirillales bacterium]|nr:hypothetical protein [Rhodospirillales bacterium]MDE2458111.1 hypothetical protein [Rhodospirillales bacterium]
MTHYDPYMIDFKNNFMKIRGHDGGPDGVLPPRHEKPRLAGGVLSGGAGLERDDFRFARAVSGPEV